MGDLEVKASMKENGITEKTKVILPLHMQVGLWILIISVTITAVGGYWKVTTSIDKIADKQIDSNIKIEELKNSKVDKITYENDRKNDADDREDMKRWMGLIMDKLEVTDYGQQPKTRLPKYEKPSGNNKREIDSLKNEINFYKNQYETSKENFNKGMQIDK